MTEKLISLHKYWIYADKMKILFTKAIKENEEEILDFPKSDVEAFQKAYIMLLGEFGVFKSFWYSSLYTVIEGYQELKLSIPDIDVLLNEENINNLRLFRNGTYHYQKEIYNHKLLSVDQTDEFVNWIYKIHKELGKHILISTMNRFPIDRQQRIKDELSSNFGDGSLKIFD